MKQWRDENGELCEAVGRRETLFAVLLCVLGLMVWIAVALVAVEWVLRRGM